MSEQEQSAKTTRSQTVDELSEDALGFGSVDLRTARDLLVRPRQVLETWMTLGPTGGGLYTRPLRLYLALNAILMLVLFLSGGSSYMLTGLPPEMLNPLIAASGKSRDAFMADADGWMTLIMVPVLATLYALVTAPLFRWWDAEDLGWRRGFRASFAYLNAWTLLILPLSWFLYGQGWTVLLASFAMWVAGVVTFLRMGRGRWYRTIGPGVAKALMILIGLCSVAAVGTMAITAVGLAAGRWF
ncbi:MAG: hypothetical protein P0Y52_02390 [Candidatus Brevundimonas phytovorans]|nr:hypothetical protein [Brevundimonas sp.]WEK58407.1 MAG: hypothetical protein P0Y52_02390 [Brevundimonas sp.]